MALARSCSNQIRATASGRALPRMCQLRPHRPPSGAPSLMPWSLAISRGVANRQPACTPSRKRGTSCARQGCGHALRQSVDLRAAP
eukprot:7170002-Alexandrium_andersonii.AAC.1